MHITNKGGGSLLSLKLVILNLVNSTVEKSTDFSPYLPYSKPLCTIIRQPSFNE